VRSGLVPGSAHGTGHPVAAARASGDLFGQRALPFVRVGDRPPEPRRGPIANPAWFGAVAGRRFVAADYLFSITISTRRLR
jgi:hypothetical protein